MSTHLKRKLSFLMFLCICNIPSFSVYAGVENLLVEPNGVEIPLIINIYGNTEPNDVNNVKEMLTQTNLILQQANVQFALEGIKKDCNDIGDGDGFLTEAQLHDILHDNLYQFQGHHGIDRGIILNIAKDIWLEKPELVFWHDIFYPVAFLESNDSPIQMGLTFARAIGTSARLQPSSESDNLMYPWILLL